MDQREVVSRSLLDCVARLDEVLRPWGFHFDHDGCRLSHTGPYASGHYVRTPTRIGISCRDTIDNIYYEHSFVIECSSWREIEMFRLSHGGFMNALGHSADCQLISSDSLPDAVAARNGGDRIAALIHDLSSFVSPVLSEPTSVFSAIIRRGARSFSIA